jgi:hypothetical protein
MVGLGPGDEPDPTPDAAPHHAPDARPDALAPAQEDAEVSLRLRQLSGPIPAPDDVVQRLDRVLESLLAERTAAPAAAHARPARPRRWSRTLLAAAAVMVAGYVGWAALPQEGSGGSASRAAGGVGALASPREPAGESDTRLSPNADSDVRPLTGAARAGGLPEVRPAYLRPDLRRAVEAQSAGGRRVGAPSRLPDACDGLVVEGSSLAVRYAGRPALVVLRRGSSEPSTTGPSRAQVSAVVLDCGGRVLARTTLRVPGR